MDRLKELREEIDVAYGDLKLGLTGLVAAEIDHNSAAARYELREAELVQNAVGKTVAEKSAWVKANMPTALSDQLAKTADDLLIAKSKVAYYQAEVDRVRCSLRVWEVAAKLSRANPDAH